MARLDGLNDDCLLMVLDFLSPNQLICMRLNKRLRELANDKLRTKTKAIGFNGSGIDYSSCHHSDSIKRDQELFVWPVVKSKVGNKVLQSPSDEASFLNLFSICSRVKSIDFASFKFPDGFLLEVVRRCPQLECIDLNKSVVKVGEWSRTLDQIGSKLVHFGKCRNKHEADVRLFELVAKKCRNIRQVGCYAFVFDDEFFSTFKRLPKTCWIKLICDDHDDFEDVIDELDVPLLRLSLLDRRVERLSSLKVELFPGPNGFVKFAGLKRLDYHPEKYDNYSVSFLVTSLFPSLEVLIFTANGLSQAQYLLLFFNMPALNELTICLGLKDDESDFELPELPYIYQLEKLETLNLRFEYRRVKNVQTKKFLQQVEEYVDEISSLKTLVVDLSECKNTEKWKETVVKEVERMNLKQDRIEVKSVREGSTRETYFKRLNR